MNKCPSGGKSNITIKGFGKDRDGNSIVKVAYPNKGFSIQTNGNLPKTHRLKAGWPVDSKGCRVMEREIISYIKKYGTAAQKSGLKVYPRRI